ncbi:hypothetical protein HF086_005599 [Spodoptera exigua]|uniref:Uncharacterized protein n=1 Tax=Spodoptera exigua TaxID=7107 RepID=A0A922MY93_SPOEX|nr:hypothetical protein HF086_005599 [Spodoptera exigua]
MGDDQSFVNSYPSVQPPPDEGVISVDVSRDALVDSMTDMSETPIPPDIITSVVTTTENEDENGRLTLAYERLYEIPKTIVERNLDALVYFKSLTSLIADDNPLTENCCLPPLPKLELL